MAALLISPMESAKFRFRARGAGCRVFSGVGAIIIGSFSIDWGFGFSDLWVWFRGFFDLKVRDRSGLGLEASLVSEELIVEQEREKSHSCTVAQLHSCTETDSEREREAPAE